MDICMQDEHADHGIAPATDKPEIEPARVDDVVGQRLRTKVTLTQLPTEILMRIIRLVAKRELAKPSYRESHNYTHQRASPREHTSLTALLTSCRTMLRIGWACLPLLFQPIVDSDWKNFGGNAEYQLPNVLIKLLDLIDRECHTFCVDASFDLESKSSRVRMWPAPVKEALFCLACKYGWTRIVIDMLMALKDDPTQQMKLARHKSDYPLLSVLWSGHEIDAILAVLAEVVGETVWHDMNAFISRKPRRFWNSDVHTGSEFLEHAIAIRNLDVVSYLLQNGCEVTTENLIKAAAEGHTGVVERLSHCRQIATEPDQFFYRAYKQAQLQLNRPPLKFIEQGPPTKESFINVLLAVRMTSTALNRQQVTEPVLGYLCEVAANRSQWHTLGWLLSRFTVLDCNLASWCATSLSQTLDIVVKKHQAWLTATILRMNVVDWVSSGRKLKLQTPGQILQQTENNQLTQAGHLFHDGRDPENPDEFFWVRHLFQGCHDPEFGSTTLMLMMNTFITYARDLCETNACQQGNIKVLRQDFAYLVKLIIRESVTGGHLPLVQEMFNNVNKWQLTDIFYLETSIPELLALAIKNNHEEILAYLLSDAVLQFSDTTASVNYNIALQHAVERGQLTLVRKLLTAPVDFQLTCRADSVRILIRRGDSEKQVAVFEELLAHKLCSFPYTFANLPEDFVLNNPATEGQLVNMLTDLLKSGHQRMSPGFFKVMLNTISSSPETQNLVTNLLSAIFVMTVNLFCALGSTHKHPLPMDATAIELIRKCALDHNCTHVTRATWDQLESALYANIGSLATMLVADLPFDGSPPALRLLQIAEQLQKELHLRYVAIDVGDAIHHILSVKMAPPTFSPDFAQLFHVCTSGLPQTLRALLSAENVVLTIPEAIACFQSKQLNETMLDILTASAHIPIHVRAIALYHWAIRDTDHDSGVIEFSDPEFFDEGEVDEDGTCRLSIQAQSVYQHEKIKTHFSVTRMQELFVDAAMEGGADQTKIIFNSCVHLCSSVNVNNHDPSHEYLQVLELPVKKSRTQADLLFALFQHKLISFRSAADVEKFLSLVFHDRADGLTVASKLHDVVTKESINLVDILFRWTLQKCYQPVDGEPPLNVALLMLGALMGDELRPLVFTRINPEAALAILQSTLSFTHHEQCVAGLLDCCGANFVVSSNNNELLKVALDYSFVNITAKLVHSPELSLSPDSAGDRQLMWRLLERMIADKEGFPVGVEVLEHSHSEMLKAVLSCREKENVVLVRKLFLNNLAPEAHANFLKKHGLDVDFIYKRNEFKSLRKHNKVFATVFAVHPPNGHDAKKSAGARFKGCFSRKK